MKLKHIFYTAAAMAMLSFQACTLDEDTSGISNPDDFFRKFSECQSVVNGCYIPIKSIYTYTYMIATECVTDIAYCPSGTLDASLAAHGFDGLAQRLPRRTALQLRRQRHRARL